VAGRTESFTKRQGGTMTYSILGEGSGAETTLVCHPGGPGMSGAYFGDLCGLGSKLRVVLMNPRGTGGSSAPEDGRYELEDYAADLGELRVHLGEERIDLVGHSHGGFVSMVYALSHPDRVRRLVLVGTTPRFGPELRAEAETAFAAHRDRPWFEDALDAQRRRQAWDFDSPEELAALYSRETRLWFGSDGAASEAIRAQLGRERLDIDALRYFNTKIAPGLDLREGLREIRVPTLIVNGEADCFGPRVSARELSEIPGSRVAMVPGAGHWVFAEASERFRTEFQDFLGSR
jgi:pimeloyl-ACP methyl ester carboxylesterase